jgi:hypothetical protein
MTRFLAIVLLGITACSSSSRSDAPGIGGGANATEPAAPDYANGSRLHASVYVSGNAKLFNTWHDTELDFDCAFDLAEDGKIRCFPMVEQTNEFSDPACTKPLIESPNPCTTPKLARVGSIGCSSQGPAIYRLGPKLAAAPSMNYRMMGTTCTAFAEDRHGNFYEGIEKIEAATLVEGTLTREKRSADFSVEVMRGTDQSVETRGIFQTAPRYHCTLNLPFVDVPKRCWPDNVAYQDAFFSDPDCRTPIALEDHYGPYCHEDPSAVELYLATSSQCVDQQEPAFAALGSESHDSLYDTVNPQRVCMTSSPADPLYRAWNVGAATPSASFAELGTREEGTGPVQVRAITAPTGERLRSGVFFDAARKAACRPARAGDGQLRCVPFNTFGALVYGFVDDACKQLASAVGSGCARPDIAMSDESDGTCQNLQHIYEVSQRASLAALYGHKGTACEMTDGPQPDKDYYFITGEIPPSTFPAITTTVE